jgi:parvulin-like peptidyl-prolyl isomerase
MSNQEKKPRVLTKKHVARLERERRQVNIVRTIAFTMFGLIALLLAYGYVDINYLQKLKPVAEVNGEKITITQWQERIQLERSNLVNQYQRYQYFQQQFGMDLSQQIQEIELYFQYPQVLGSQVLDTMINDVLVRQEAEKLGITVSDEEVEKAIQEAYGFFQNGTPTPTLTPTEFVFEYPTFTSQQLTLYPSTATPTQFVTPSPAPTSTTDPAVTPTVTFTAPPPTQTFTPAPPTPTFVPEDITATPTPYTLDGFKESYQTTVDQMAGIGVSEKTLREVYKNSLLRTKLMEAVISASPTDQQVLARHILVDDATLAESLRQDLLNGADFAETAKEYSKDTGSAVDGGSLGWFGRNEMVSEFEQAAFSQEIGEIGPIVQTDFGFHIIQVIARQELPVSASQAEQNRQVAFTQWLETVRITADIIEYEDRLTLIPPMPDFSSQ